MPSLPAVAAAVAFALSLVVLPTQPVTAQDAPAASSTAPGVVSPALTPADLYTVGAQAGWVFEQAGKRIGFHWFTYKGPAELPGGRLHHFVAGVLLHAVPRVSPEQRFLTDLWVDDRGHPVRHLLRARLGDVASELELTISDGTAQVHLVQGGTPRDFELPVPAEAFLQLNNALGYFELMLALQPVPADGSHSYTLFSSNVLQSFPYEATRAAGDEDLQADVVLTDSLGETLTLDAAGRKLLSVEVAAQALVIRRTDEELETFALDEAAVDAADEPSLFESEEVVIRHGEVSLAGTLTFPPESAPPYAAVFFISGSGGQDRNGRASGLDLGTHEILDRLTADGFLVLRVDDRGVGQSTGPTKDMSFDDLVDDARACLDFLALRADVDPARVALIGHSEGGVTAPLLAVERPELAAVVLMAATGRKLSDVIMDQNAVALDDQGIVGEEREQALASARRALEWAASDKVEVPGDLPAEMAEGMAGMREWLRSHARQDPLATIGQVTCPVLVLQGAMDFQVSVERDARPLDAALTEAGLTQHELVVFPGLDHLFKPVEGEVSRLSDYYEKRAVDEDFLNTLSGWLSEHVLPDR